MIFCLICALSFHTQCGGCFNDSNAARGAEHTADLWWWWTYTTFVGKLSTDTSPPPVLVVFWSRSFRIYARSSFKSWILFLREWKNDEKNNFHYRLQESNEESGIHFVVEAAREHEWKRQNCEIDSFRTMGEEQRDENEKKLWKLRMEEKNAKTQIM